MKKVIVLSLSILLFNPSILVAQSQADSSSAPPPTWVELEDLSDDSKKEIDDAQGQNKYWNSCSDELQQDVLDDPGWKDYCAEQDEGTDVEISIPFCGITLKCKLKKLRPNPDGASNVKNDNGTYKVRLKRDVSKHCQEGAPYLDCTSDGGDSRSDDKQCELELETSAEVVSEFNTLMN